MSIGLGSTPFKIRVFANPGQGTNNGQPSEFHRRQIHLPRLGLQK
ncbi:MAG: hypothetical protein ACKOD5_07170 [Chthoniobacterales bacterium]